MPAQLSYPGVYIEEIPSGVRTIVGVPTSIAAFVGRAKRGPTNEPRVINGYADFDRIYGGLWAKTKLGFAVRDFFLNGGGQAVIVRLYREEAAPKRKAKITWDGTFKVEAANEGEWGNKLRIRVDHDVTAEAAARFGVPVGELFNLSVWDGDRGEARIFRNVTVVESPRRIDRVLENESDVLRVAAALPAARPAKHAALDPTKNVWTDDTLSQKVTTDADDGRKLVRTSFTGGTTAADKEGLYALEKCDIFNLLCIPPYDADDAFDIDKELIDEAVAYCRTRRAVFLIDPRSTWTTKEAAKTKVGTEAGSASSYAALYFPRIKQANPLRDDQIEEFVPCGAVAGVIARTDTVRGVWKAPAGLEATLVGVPAVSVPLNDPENGELNPLGINCLRAMPPSGRIIWGARTREGDDRLSSEWKYLPVRRLALYIEESLYRGTKWAVFEPNDEPLWGQLRLNVGAFMQGLFRQSAFAGSSPRDAYYVRCDRQTTTQNDVNLGVVNIVVGFAPLKPAEFVVIKIQQIAGQIET